MVGRPRREYEVRRKEPFAFADLFYRRSSMRERGWRTTRYTQLQKGIEHAFGLRALERMAIEQNVDVVHFQWLVIPLLDRIALNRLRKRCGLVITVHNADVVPHSRQTMVGSIGARAQALGVRGALSCFDRFVAHSVKTADRLMELGIPSDRIVQLKHPPLELDVPEAGPRSLETRLRQEILFFGSIKPYKGVDVLVDAGIAMASHRRDFRITVAGRPYQSMKELQLRIAQANANDVFRFDLDFVADTKIAEYMTEASIVVFPYREIDGSGALSHALQYGKPIVASNVGGFAEPPFNDYIELVRPDDSTALAETLAQLLDNPARIDVLRQGAVKLRTMLPTWSDYAKACAKAYESIAGGSSIYPSA